MAGLIWVLSFFFSVSFVLLFYSPASSDTRTVVTQRLRGRPSIFKAGVSTPYLSGRCMQVTSYDWWISHSPPKQ
ncbi:hypothetical protein V8C43DRAFT_144612 [Trichoderma afarasin]